MSAPEEDEMETSKVAGYLLLGAFALGVLYVLAMALPRITTLIVWGLGWTGLIWGWRRMQVAPNPAPPPPPERGSEEEPQVKTVKDPEHPNRWIVLPDDRTGTE
jgi:hypothetical protein